jgi:VCBS repeat-containing protein
MKRNYQIRQLLKAWKSSTGKTIALMVAMFLLCTTISSANILTQKNLPARDGSKSIVWDATISFTNPTGQNDYVVFGEAPDANDGPPADSYDVAKPPAPMPSYIRAYFKDNLPSPYTNLWRDYRFYPDTDKTWNLSVQWVPEDEESSSIITFTWIPADIDESEYTTVNLCTDAGVVLKDMFIDTSYTYTSAAYQIQKFKIICVSSGNQPPVANPDSYSTNEDTTLTIAAPGVLANDNDPNGDTLTAVKQSDPSHGTVTLNSNGGFTYIPTSNYFGSDSFTYKAFDGALYSNLATVSITVNAVNDAPVAYPDSYTTNEDVTLTITAPGVLGNDVDVDGDTLTAVKVTDPTHGAVTLNSNGGFTYIPSSNYYGSDAFTYKAYDGTVYSNTVSVSLTINSVNDPPVVTDIPDQTITEGSSFSTISLDNYVSDPDNTDAQMTWTYSGNVQLIVSIVNRVATITTPNADWYGSETITFRATDPSGLWDEDPATFTVTNVNDPPVVTNIPDQTIAEGSSFTPINLDNYVSDVDNPDSQMTWTYSGNVELIVSIVNRVATITTPNADWYGSETITFRATDPGGLWDEDPATFTVTPVNDPPVANPDSYSTNENTPLTIPAPGVLGNDFDVEGDSLTAEKVSDPTHGAVVLNSDGGFTYTPDENYYGDDTFTYKAYDGAAYSNVASVTISVLSQNQPPVATDDTATVPFDSANNKIDVLANDEDPDGDTLIITSVSGASHGTTSTDGAFVYYTPTAGYSGADSFTYTIDDNHGGTDTGTVSITVQPNGAPQKPERPTGPTSGNSNVEYTFNTTTTDPNNHQIYYQWDWGDGTTSEWFGPYGSGELSQAKHSWGKGSYSIKVKAKDIYGAESAWSEPLAITMPFSFNLPFHFGLFIYLLIHYIHGEYQGMTFIQLLRAEGWFH